MSLGEQPGQNVPVSYIAAACSPREAAEAAAAARRQPAARRPSRRRAAGLIVSDDGVSGEGASRSDTFFEDFSVHHLDKKLVQFILRI